MQRTFFLGAFVASTILSGPALPDIITFDGETYAGRITSVDLDEVIFDLECQGDLYSIPTSYNLILEFAEGCGTADIMGTGGGWQIDICYDDDHSWVPPEFWEISVAGDTYWGTDISIGADDITLHWDDGTNETFSRTNVFFAFYDFEEFLEGC